MQVLKVFFMVVDYAYTYVKKQFRICEIQNQDGVRELPEPIDDSSSEEEEEEGWWGE